jgi:hypothetical protein
VAYNLGFNNGQQMAGARVTICLPFFNDRRQGIVINANKLRDARSYAKSPPGHHFINWAMSMAAACDCRGRFAKCYSGALSSPLRRNVRFCTLRIILWQLFLAVEILLRDPSHDHPCQSFDDEDIEVSRLVQTSAARDYSQHQELNKISAQHAGKQSDEAMPQHPEVVVMQSGGSLRKGLGCSPSIGKQRFLCSA